MAFIQLLGCVELLHINFISDLNVLVELWSPDHDFVLIGNILERWLLWLAIISMRLTVTAVEHTASINLDELLIRYIKVYFLSTNKKLGLLFGLGL